MSQPLRAHKADVWIGAQPDPNIYAVKFADFSISLGVCRKRKTRPESFNFSNREQRRFGIQAVDNNLPENGFARYEGPSSSRPRSTRGWTSLAHWMTFSRA